MMEQYINLFTQHGSLPVLFALSFFGGLVASISPCSLAMLPIIVGYVGGYSDEKPVKTFVQMLFFVFGTAIVFSIIGIICAITGKVFISFAGGYFGIFLAGIIMVMGLKLIGVLDFELPVVIKEMPKNDGTNTYLYPVILGGVFALAGTPCSTPILAGIMAFAAMGKNLIAAVIMLFLFALGQGLILIIAGIFTSTLKNLKKAAGFTDTLMKISGVLLILVAVYLYYKVFAPLL